MYYIHTLFYKGLIILFLFITKERFFMNSKQLKYIPEILDSKGIKKSLSSLTPKESKVAMKKLRQLLKEVELLRRMGGVTLVVAGDRIITTYHNNSMNRKGIINKNKVIY